MDSRNNNSTVLSFDELMTLVNKASFFNEKEKPAINNSLLKQTILNSIDLPFKLKCYANKQNILNLEDLVNTETKLILRSRNIGEATIAKSRKIILEHLKKIRDCLVETEPEKYLTELKDKSYFVGKYFPLLRDNFATTQIYFNLAKKDISLIKLPKFIKVYVKKKKNLKSLLDLLNTNYNELIEEPMIGRRTIEKLQVEIIEMLNLRKVIFLNV